MGTHSLGHQRAARPARKNRGPGTAVHRRDASADGKTLHRTIVEGFDPMEWPGITFNGG